MAFNGSYYIKVGDYPIPLKYMFKGSYKVSVNTQDLDSYRDGNGKLHRNVLPHQADKLEFEVPYTTVKQFRTLMDNLRQQMNSGTIIQSRIITKPALFICRELWNTKCSTRTYICRSE